MIIEFIFQNTISSGYSSKGNVCFAAVCCVQLLSHVRLSVSPWTVARQAPLPMELSRQEHWSGLPFPPPGDLASQGMEHRCLVSAALAGRFFTTGSPWEFHAMEVTSVLSDSLQPHGL